MPATLTEKGIASARAKAKLTGKRHDLADAGQAGLRLRITPAGGATWALACRDRQGRMRRFMLGQYSDQFGIAAARDAARALHHKVTQEGSDPTQERREERKAAKVKQVASTLATLLDLYERQKGGKLRSWPEYRRSIGNVFSDYLETALPDLKLGDLQMTADGHKAQSEASLAVRCLRPVLKWAAAPGRGYVPVELAAISPPASVQRRDRVLSREELAKLLPTLRASEKPYAAALRFMLLTLLRREEACGATWGDVDMPAGTLTIPAERSKNRQPHVVPLSSQALDLLRARKPAKLVAEALVFSTSTGEALGNWDRETKKLQTASGTGDWHRHDLRRTGATMLGEMGELPDIIEAALNHASIRSPLAATYNRARYRPQVAIALQRLADALDGIEAGAAKVIQLHKVAG